MTDIVFGFGFSLSTEVASMIPGTVKPLRKKLVFLKSTKKALTQGRGEETLAVPTMRETLI